MGIVRAARLTRWPLWNRYNRVARGRDKIFIWLIITAAVAADAYTTRLNVVHGNGGRTESGMNGARIVWMYRRRTRVRTRR